MLPPFFIFKSNLCLGFLWSPHCRLISGLVSLFRTPLWLLFTLSLSVCGIRLLKYIINRGLVCHDNEDWMQHFTKQKRKGDVRLRGAGATDKRSKKIERVKKRNWRRSVCGGGGNCWLWHFKNLQVVNEKNLHSPSSLSSCDKPLQRLTGDFNLPHCILDGRDGLHRPNLPSQPCRGVHSLCDMPGNVYECIKWGW